MPDDDLVAANDRLVREFLAAWERRDAAHIVDAFARMYRGKYRHLADA